MLQQCASEDEFYIHVRGFELLKFIEPVPFERCIFLFSWHKKKYHIGQIFRYT